MIGSRIDLNHSILCKCLLLSLIPILCINILFVYAIFYKRIDSIRASNSKIKIEK